MVTRPPAAYSRMSLPPPHSERFTTAVQGTLRRPLPYSPDDADLSPNLPERLDCLIEIASGVRGG